MAIDLRQGDCLELLRDIPDGSVDMVLTDPPYGTTACKWDSVIDFDLMWKELKRIIKPNGAIALFGSEPFSSALRMSNIEQYKYDWAWVKNHTSGQFNAKRQPLRAYENVHIFYTEQPTYNPQMVERTEDELKRLSYKSNTRVSKNNIYGDIKSTNGNRFDHKLKYPRNTITDIKCVFNRSREKVAHPTQKPVALMEYLIKTYTNEGEIVLDFTAGSMSTAISCINTNRKGIMIEKDSHYFKLGSERVERALSELR